MTSAPGTLRRVALSVALLGGAGALVPFATGSSAAVVEPAAVPRAVCAAGSLPETGRQGRVEPADRKDGRAAKGYRCNATPIGRYGSEGGFKTLRYVDAAGHECAYFDVPYTSAQPGVRVLDMAQPTRPRLTARLTTPAMLSPHESLDLNQRRGLLVAVMGTAATAPGIFDVYDVKKDCRHPVLLSSTPTGIAGHEGGMSPDGRTFFATSALTSTLVAIDLDDPKAPKPVYVGAQFVHGVSVSDDGSRAYLSLFPPGVLAPRGAPRDLLPPAGLRVLDIRQIRDRAPVPQAPELSTTTWPTVSFPQNSVPLTVGGHPYLLEFDEFSDFTSRVAGAVRILDVAGAPKVVSDIRLEANRSTHNAEQQDDPGADATLGGYAAHYCAAPSRTDPGIVACSFILSGMRVFDVRDPLHPKEVAYESPPQPGTTTAASVSAPAFVPARREVWYTDGTGGFRVVRLTAAAWPTARGAAAPVRPAAAPAAAPAASPSTAPRTSPAPARPATAAGTLAATGPALPLGLGVLLAGLALVVRRRTATA
ncbi:MAG: hypothetical protein JWM64_1410 [Frankiales bacterium]|nr:hypothetical protein [Frankiales bacterium]